MGHVVGFMGDGINDAPALHASDVGISVDGAADVARQAADLILLEHELSVVHEAMLPRPRDRAERDEIHSDGQQFQFRQHVQHGRSRPVPAIPADVADPGLAQQSALRSSQTAIPFDRVDKEATERPTRWDLGLIQRFMLVFGPVSSLFDFLTFYALLHLFGAGEALFQTGWFVESLATQVLVILAIRTKRPLFRSAPHPLLAGMACGVVALGLLLPFTAPGRWFGFVPLPPLFFVYLLLAILAYLALVEGAKRAFYRRNAYPTG